MKIDEGVAIRAAEEFLALLDAEDWDGLVGRLNPHAQLADELTGSWLRGKADIARYLRAQRDVVTDIISEPADLVGRGLTDSTWFVTFNFDQQYRLVGVHHRQHMTGCFVVDFKPRGWEVLVFHLGGPGGFALEHSLGRQLVDHAGIATPSAPPPPVDVAVPSLGEVVKERRERRQMSLRNLADRSGLSASFLSQVERSLTDPSVGSIRQIAAGLGVPAADIIAECETAAPGVLLARRGDREAVAPEHTGVRVEQFASSPDVSLRAIQLDYDPKVVLAGSDGLHDVDEFIYVLAGSIELTTNALRVNLAVGDGVTIRAGYRHSYRPLYGENVQLLVVTAKPPHDTTGDR